MTILSVFLIGLSFSGSGFRFAAQFQVAVIYSYAGSLAFLSALHYLFTRIVADLVWENRHEEAAGWMIRFAVAAVLISTLLSSIVMTLMPLEIEGGPGLYRLACVLLFVSVNLMWIVMLFVSLLRRYMAILVVFAAGMAVAVGLVAILSRSWGAGGAVLGYAAGHAITAAGLLVLSLGRYHPKAPAGGWAFVFRYAKKYRGLILSGALFYLGQWADKFAFWASRGEVIPGTPLRLFAAYDVPVYLAGLSIIPGLVYFVIYSETEIAASIRRFLSCLGHDTLGRIREAKDNLGIDLRREFRDQSLFQMAFSVGAAVLVLRRGGNGLSELIALVAIAGAFFQFTLMTLLNFLFYFELFAQALAGSLLFFVLNGLAFPLVQIAFPNLPPGSGYLASAAAAAALCYVSLNRAVPQMDRIVFLRSVRRDG
jgi:uncharacterized membrane protein